MSDVVVAGGSGLVGGLLLDRFSMGSGHETHALLRRPVKDRSGITQHIADPANWPAAIAAIRPAIVISTLGTTIAQAGSQAAFRAIDHDLVVAVAGAAKMAGARHCITISSVGAIPASNSFYLRTKAEVEQVLHALGFNRLDILRPGLLIGDRRGPARPGEALAMRAAPVTDLLFHGPLRRFRSIPAASVARAIAALAAFAGSGAHAHHYDEILALAD